MTPVEIVIYINVDESSELTYMEYALKAGIDDLLALWESLLLDPGSSCNNILCILVSVLCI